MQLDELKKVFKGEISEDAPTLEKYATDASIFKIMPAAVVYPKDVEDVKNLVRWVTAARQAGQDITITARSGGTDMTGGPLTESIVVDFTKYFNQIISVTMEEAVVQPGLFYRDLEPKLQALGAMLPSYPASKEICTVGGMVSNNSGGEKTLAYGKTERYVSQLKMVWADGEEHVIRVLGVEDLKAKLSETGFEAEIFRNIDQLIQANSGIIQGAKPNVSKNSAGYYLWNVWDGQRFDLNKLLVGSQGTLGFITEITFRLVREKKHSRLAVVFLKNLDPLARIAEDILKFHPESFESYDDHTLQVAMRFLPDLVKSLKSNLIKLAFDFFPEFLMLLRGGLPKMILLVELTSDDEEELNARMDGLKAKLMEFPVTFRITKNEAEEHKYWTVRRESFNLLRHRIKNRQTVPFIDDVIVDPSKLTDFLPRLNALLEPYGQKLIYTIAGHVGDGNFHIIPLMDLSDPESRKLIPEISDKVYPLVMEFKGSITAEHNDGLIRTPYLKLMYGTEIYALFEEVKKIFDPAGIFNPRKKVGGDFGYSMAHLKVPSK